MFEIVCKRYSFGTGGILSKASGGLRLYPSLTNAQLASSCVGSWGQVRISVEIRNRPPQATILSRRWFSAIPARRSAPASSTSRDGS